MKTELFSGAQNLFLKECHGFLCFVVYEEFVCVFCCFSIFEKQLVSTWFGNFALFINIFMLDLQSR